MPPKRRHPAPAPSAGFADQLRQVIAGRRLTAYSVARAAGVAPSVVSRFLSRERGLTLETFDQVAGALGLRLVEGGRGKGRPAKIEREISPMGEIGDVPDGQPGGMEAAGEFDTFDTHPGPDATAVPASSDVEPAEVNDRHDAIGHMVMDDDGVPPPCLAGALRPEDPEPERPLAGGETDEAEAAGILDLVAGWPPEWRQEHENVANLLAWEGYSWEYAQAEAFRRIAGQVAARVGN